VFITCFTLFFTTVANIGITSAASTYGTIAGTALVYVDSNNNGNFGCLSMNYNVLPWN
jgi:hypothetical protein